MLLSFLQLVDAPNCLQAGETKSVSKKSKPVARQIPRYLANEE
jgi:hypothetical protein